MAALLRRTPTPLSEPEVLMMLQWLNTISTADQVQDSQRIHSARNALTATRRREAAPTSEDGTKFEVRNGGLARPQVTSMKRANSNRC
jgi:hypothetical protein